MTLKESHLPTMLLRLELDSSVIWYCICGIVVVRMFSSSNILSLRESIFSKMLVYLSMSLMSWAKSSKETIWSSSKIASWLCKNYLQKLEFFASCIKWTWLMSSKGKKFFRHLKKKLNPRSMADFRWIVSELPSGMKPFTKLGQLLFPIFCLISMS